MKRALVALGLAAAAVAATPLCSSASSWGAQVRPAALQATVACRAHRLSPCAEWLLSAANIGLRRPVAYNSAWTAEMSTLRYDAAVLLTDQFIGVRPQASVYATDLAALAAIPA